MDFRQWYKRLSYILLVYGLILISLVGRLYQKSVIEHGEIVQAAENQYAFRKEVVGQRGSIVVDDHKGALYPLANNERRYQVLVIPPQIKNAREVANKLAPIVGVSEQDIFTKIDTKKPYVPPIQRRLSREQADQIAGLKLHGVSLLPEYIRTYPEQGLASQLLGFVNAEGKGNYGIEGAYDLTLKGSSGYRTGEKDIRGRLISLDDEVAAKDGNTVMLTIDREIQFFVEKSLADSIKKYEADGGSVVIVNPKTGAIVAMASSPGFNPNKYNEVKSDQQQLFLNPAVSSAWEPGSIMKPIVMALAMDKGHVEPDTKSVFAASVKVLNHEIFTAEKKAFGEETMTQVLENSDNVGMVWVADKLGNQDFHDALSKLGFGKEPDIKLGNVSAGSLPALKTWNDLTRATISFGQGVSTTPLQMVMAYAAMANQGKAMQPYVVQEVIDDQGQTVAKSTPQENGQVMSAETSKKIGDMLESVVLRGHGKRAQVKGYRIGGKTGTAQVVKPEGGYYEDRHIGSFAGYFPITDPQYAMVVKLDNPRNVEFAESSAAPTFGEIAGWILHQKQIKQDAPTP